MLLWSSLPIIITVNGEVVFCFADVPLYVAASARHALVQGTLGLYRFR